MTEAELYKELGALTKNKEKWRESIPYVSSLLTHGSVKIQAKALWLLGEMGLIYPQSVQDTVPAIASFLDSPEPLLRERALNALGRIGRGSCPLIEPCWTDLFRFIEILYFKHFYEHFTFGETDWSKRGKRLEKYVRVAIAIELVTVGTKLEDL